MNEIFDCSAKALLIPDTKPLKGMVWVLKETN